MSFFNFRSNPDRQLLKHPLLKGKRLLGKGMMSGTFECDATSVYKVTCDVAQYRFMEEVEPHWFFPRFIEGFGQIAEDVYLLRCERLEKCIRPASGQGDFCIRQGTGEGDFCIRQAIGIDEALLEAVKAYCAEHPQAGAALALPWSYEAEFLLATAATPKFAPIREALQSLAAFIARTGYRLDCHLGNFMMRGEQFVFNDPVSQMFRRHQPDSNNEFAHNNRLL